MIVEPPRNATGHSSQGARNGPAGRRLAVAGQRPAALARAAGPRPGPDLGAALAALLRALAAGAPATLVTGLALGADQMAVAAARRCKADGLPWTVEAVLPCPLPQFIALAVPDYALTAAPPRAAPASARMIAHWRGVLAGVDRLRTLPARWLPSDRPPPLPAPAAHAAITRAFGPPALPAEPVALDYGPAGEAILAGADMLVALWDGSPSRGAGGTADMVTKARASGLPVLVLDPATGRTDLTADAILERLNPLK